MNFSDSLLRLTIKNWAAHQKLPEKQLDSLIRRARFSNALLKRKRLPLGAAGLTTARQKRAPLPLEQLLSPLSLVGMDKTTLLAPDNNQL